MNTDDYIDLFDDLDDNDETENFLNKGRRRKRFPDRHFKVVRARNAKFLEGQDDLSRSFNFTYKAARFEEWWLLESLGDFYEHQWITDVLRRVKGGKEASVYMCRGGEVADSKLVTAKVYRPRVLRNLKNDGIYRTGRTDLDISGNAIIKEADKNAIRRRTNYGERLRHQSWIAYELKTLELLYEAGADVPKPYAMEKNAILMDYIGDLNTAAPTLNAVSLDPDEAHLLFYRVIHNIDLLLSNDRIHGDLSAYNILYWDGDITLIDFPQVVSPEANPSAWVIFLRDVTRICQYFSSQGVEADAGKLAVDLWTSYGHRLVEEVHPLYLDADDQQDRELLDKQKDDE
ncbi:MAG TPA: RIO1 family regulatory kinase/ATPase [Anaerolineales bacterium]|nr:RIO1 family regulatory kinase/ATPase [Anaerolineales bacterium]